MLSVESVSILKFVNPTILIPETVEKTYKLFSIFAYTVNSVAHPNFLVFAVCLLYHTRTLYMVLYFTVARVQQASER